MSDEPHCECAFLTDRQNFGEAFSFRGNEWYHARCHRLIESKDLPHDFKAYGAGAINAWQKIKEQA